MARPPKKTPNLYQRGKKGIYWTRITIDGREYPESTKTTDLAEAKAVLAKRQTEVFEGRWTPNKRKTDLSVKGLSDLWLQCDSTKAKKSYGHDVARFATVVRLLKPSTLVNRLTLEDMHKLQRQLRGLPGKRSGTTMANASVNRHFALLRAALAHAKASKYDHQDPLIGLKFLEEREKDELFTRQQYEAIVRHPKATPDIQLACHIAFATGLRLANVCDLDWSLIDLTKREISLPKTMTKTGEALKIGIKKSLLPVLEAARTAERRGQLARIRGKLITVTSQTVCRTVSAICDDLGWPDHSFHAFRHGLVTSMLESGASQIEVMQQTGHKSIVSLARYATIGHKRKLQLLDRLDEDEIRKAGTLDS